MVSCSEGLWRGSPIPTPTAPQHPGTPDPLHTPHFCRDLVKATFGKPQAFTKKTQRVRGMATALTERCFGNSPTAAIPCAVFNRELPLRFQMPLHALTQQESHPCKLGLQFAPRIDIFAGLGRFLQRLPSTGLCWWVAAPWYPGAAISCTSPQLKFNSKMSSCPNNT